MDLEGVEHLLVGVLRGGIDDRVSDGGRGTRRRRPRTPRMLRGRRSVAWRDASCAGVKPVARLSSSVVGSAAVRLHVLAPRVPDPRELADGAVRQGDRRLSALRRAPASPCGPRTTHRPRTAYRDRCRSGARRGADRRRPPAGARGARARLPRKPRARLAIAGRNASTSLRHASESPHSAAITRFRSCETVRRCRVSGPPGGGRCILHVSAWVARGHGLLESSAWSESRPGWWSESAPEGDLFRMTGIAAK